MFGMISTYDGAHWRFMPIWGCGHLGGGAACMSTCLYRSANRNAQDTWPGVNYITQNEIRAIRNERRQWFSVVFTNS